MARYNIIYRIWQARPEKSGLSPFFVLTAVVFHAFGGTGTIPSGCTVTTSGTGMIDLKVLMVEKEDCDAGTVQQLRNGLLSDKAQYKVLRDAADTLRKRLATAVAPTLGKIHLKLGISLYFLGQCQ